MSVSEACQQYRVFLNGARLEAGISQDVAERVTTVYYDTALSTTPSVPPGLSPFFQSSTDQLLVSTRSNMTSTTALKGDKFDRQLFESVIKRRFFFTEAFEIYRLSPDFKGDNRGLFDYGPLGCALQANIVEAWRKHFVLEENMVELDCTVIKPELVLKTSGHVDKFADWMCKDPVKGKQFSLFVI
jgi:hypothetical protein